MVRKICKFFVLFLLMISVSISVRPFRASGEVKPITEANEKLQGISEQEQETLEKLFTLTQEIEKMEREEERIAKEINGLSKEIKKLDENIKKEQESYDDYLGLLKQVLVSYQRGGPASYIDIILKSEDLASLIKSLNLIKDISRNTGELLASIEESRLNLEKKRQELSDNMNLLEEKKDELKEALTERQKLAKELEDFLDSLKEEKELYQEHLNNLKLMWENLKEIFSNIVDEFSRIIGEGHFTMEDLNLKFNFFSLKGSIEEDTFNRRINENSNLSDIFFHFENNGIRIEIPDNNLVLEGNFVIRDETVLEFVPESGTFYNMALEKESIEELFKDHPMIIDFKKVAGDMMTMDIKLKELDTEDGYLYFTIDTNFLF